VIGHLLVSCVVRGQRLSERRYRLALLIVLLAMLIAEVPDSLATSLTRSCDELGCFDVDDDPDRLARKTAFLAATSIAGILVGLTGMAECSSSGSEGSPRNSLHRPQVMIRYDPPEVLVYLDHYPAAPCADPIVAESACRYLLAEEVPLPVPYSIWLVQRAGEAKRYVPQQRPITTGVLSTCPGPSRQ
jgi:hypothetical protein